MQMVDLDVWLRVYYPKILKEYEEYLEWIE